MFKRFTGLLALLPEEDQRIGEMLVACGTLTRNELDAALLIQSIPYTAALLVSLTSAFNLPASLLGNKPIEIMPAAAQN